MIAPTTVSEKMQHFILSEATPFRQPTDLSFGSSEFNSSKPQPSIAKRVKDWIDFVDLAVRFEEIFALVNFLTEDDLNALDAKINALIDADLSERYFKNLHAKKLIDAELLSQAMNRCKKLDNFRKEILEHVKHLLETEPDDDEVIMPNLTEATLKEAMKGPFTKACNDAQELFGEMGIKC